MKDTQKEQVKDLLDNFLKENLDTMKKYNTVKNIFEILLWAVFIIGFILQCTVGVNSDDVKVFLLIFIPMFSYALFYLLFVRLGLYKNPAMNNFLKFKLDVIKVLYPQFNFEYTFEEISNEKFNNLYRFVEKCKIYEHIFNDKYEIYDLYGNIYNYEKSYRGLLLLNHTDNSINAELFGWFNISKGVYFKKGDSILFSLKTI